MNDNRLKSTIIIAILLVALLSRLALTLLEWRYNFLSMHFYTADTVLYDALAQSVVAGNGFSINGRPSAFRSPGYPLFLAFLYSLVGRDFFLISLIQCFIGALTCFLVYGIAKQIFNEKIALVSALFYALAPYMILWTSGYILTEPLFIFLTLASLYCSLWLLPATEQDATRQVSLAALAGALLALAALTRPVFFYFSLLTIIYLMLKASWQKGAITFVAFALLMAPWVVRNYQVFGQMIFTTTGGGWVLYEYHNPKTTASNGGMNPQWTSSGALNAQVPRFKEAADLPETGIDEFYSKKAVSFALENPVREIKLSFNRFWNIWRPTFATARGYNVIVAWLTYVPMMLFALPGVFYYGFRNSRHGLLTMFLLYHFFFYLFFVAEIRFRYPLEAVLLIYAAAGAVKLLRAVSQREHTEIRTHGA